MRSTFFPALALGGAILSCAAHAGAIDTAPPSATDVPAETRVEPVDPGLSLWEAGIGAAAFSTPAYPGASDRSNRALALPFLIYRGKVLRADQNGVGARLLNTDKVELDIGFAAALPSRSDDVDARRGMPDLGTLVEFGPRVKVKFADLGDYGRVRAELPLRSVIEGRGGLRRQGWTTEPRLVWEQRADDGRWSVEGQLGALFGDRRINRYFYEVAPRYATVERPAYAADAGLMLVRTGVFGTWRMNPDVRVFGFVRYESYAGAANRASPLMRQSTGASAGIGFAWTLARSAARASVAE